MEFLALFGGLFFLGWAVMCAAWDIVDAMKKPREITVNVHFVEPECPGCDEWDYCDEDEVGDE